MLHVFRVHIGHDGDGGPELGEGAIALISLQDDPVPPASLRVRAIGVDDAAIDHGRVHTGTIEKRSHHGRCCCLAVRAGDSDRPFHADDLGQHIGAAHNRDTLGAGSLNLDIVALDRRRDDHRPCTIHIFWLVADMDGRALLTKALDIGALLYVRALNLVAEIDHDLGNAGHADAANADKVGRAEFEWGWFEGHAGCFATCSARSARSLAAVIVPVTRASAARFFKSVASSIRTLMSSPNRFG